MTTMTFTWNAGTTGDWATGANWAGGSAPPSNDTTDAALFGSTSASTSTGTYVVTVSSAQSIGTLDLQNTGHKAPAFSINGRLTVGTLDYLAATSGAVNITINGGGLLDITGGIVNGKTTVGETISIKSSGTSGGTLELASPSVNAAGVTMKFANNISAENFGAIQFDAFANSTSQTISNVAWGDKFVFVGQDFTNDQVSLDTSTHVLTVMNGATTVLTMNHVNLASGATNSFQVYGDTIEDVCYARGTRIRTAAGETRVESLRPGDAVVTLVEGRHVIRAVKWVGRRRLDLTSHPHPERAAPVRIRAGAFAENMPWRDLLVSPDHAIFVDGMLIAARQLMNGTTIRQEVGRASVEYFHVELDSHAILLAEGLPAESYLDTANRGFFANSGLPLVLHPDLTEDRSEVSRAAGACAPFVVDEASVRPVWQRLADRAAALGQAPAAVATTTDPDLHLVAKGRHIRPMYGQNGLFLFPLPIGATGVRLRSRAAPPSDARPWLDDRRRLGLSVARIVLRTADEVLEIPVDHPDLADGWWDVEREGPALMHRWTDGNALIPLPARSGHWMLEIQVRGEMIYPLEGPAEAERRVA